MIEAYNAFKDVLEDLSGTHDLEVIVAALHILTIQCEQTMRVKLTTELLAADDDAE
jgi:hypothetical protein